MHKTTVLYKLVFIYNVNNDKYNNDKLLLKLFKLLNHLIE